MKLTKEMFDFEKYDYFDELKPEMAKGTEWLDSWGDWAPLTKHTISLPRALCLCRQPKPLPRYILLNEGEMLQAEDEMYLGSGEESQWGALIILNHRRCLRGEVWRRKDTTK